MALIGEKGSKETGVAREKRVGGKGFSFEAVTDPF